MSNIPPMWNKIVQLLKGAPPAPGQGAAEALAFDGWPAAVYAVGDVHGRLDLLTQLEDAIERDAAAVDGERWIVMLGDYVDRGPDSAGVLDHLTARPRAGFRRFCVAGNHERMMLRFVDGGRNYNWLDSGGFETLLSYGIPAERIDACRSSRARMRSLLDGYVPEEHFAFLRGLPTAVSLPGLVFAHMPPPGSAAERETGGHAMAVDLRLDHDEGAARRVHGHKVVEDVALDGRAVNLDTGAYVTGRLSALRLFGPDSLQLIQTAGNGSVPDARRLARQ